MSTGVPTWYPWWAAPGSGTVPFEVVVTCPAPAVAVVSVVGDLDLVTCPELDVVIDNELHQPLDTRVRDMILDFTKVGLLSVRGVRSVLRAQADARAKRIGLQLVLTPTHPVRRVLALLHLDDQLRVQPDLTAARRAAA